MAVLRVFQVCFKTVVKGLCKGFQCCDRVCQGCVEGMATVYQGNFEGGLRVFQECLDSVQRAFNDIS